MRNPKRHLTKEQMVEIIRNWEAKNDNKTTSKQQIILKYRHMNEDDTEYGGTYLNPGLPRQH